MQYIMTATKSEAQAFVDKFKLSKEKSNSEITVVVSGVGIENMFNKATTVVSNMKENDTILNVGICGANTNFEIGELLNICTDTKSVRESYLSCVDKEINEKNKYDIVDMESTGFLNATKTIKNRYIFKVVSDHFEPQTVTKDKTKKLIYDKIDDIMKKVEE